MSDCSYYVIVIPTDGLVGYLRRDHADNISQFDSRVRGFHNDTPDATGILTDAGTWSSWAAASGALERLREVWSGEAYVARVDCVLVPLG